MKLRKMVAITVLMSDIEVEIFFTGGDQMGITVVAFNKLKDQGIKSPIDLIDFDKDGIDKLIENIQKISKKQEGFIGAKSQKRLTEAAELVWFYNEIGREIEAGSMDYESVIWDFMKQWTAIKEMKDSQKDTEVPKILTCD